jgi:hypothetical protein
MNEIARCDVYNMFLRYLQLASVMFFLRVMFIKIFFLRVMFIMVAF